MTTHTERRTLDKHDDDSGDAQRCPRCNVDPVTGESTGMVAVFLGDEWLCDEPCAECGEER